MLIMADPILTEVVLRLRSFWNDIVDVFEISIQKIMDALQRAVQPLAPVAAFASRLGLGPEGLEEAIGSISHAAPISTAATRGMRREDVEGATESWREDSAKRVAEAEAKVAELRQRQNELAEQGRLEAAEKLETERQALETALAQAQAEREAAEENQARASEARDILLQEQEVRERLIRIERERQGLVERFDPVAKYMRELRELNALFEEAERETSDVYKRRLMEMQEELADQAFKVDVEFGVRGMDAVRKATREEQQLIENTIETLQRKKSAEQAEAEVQRRQNEIEAENAKRGVDANPDLISEPVHINRERDDTDLLMRIASATETLAGRDPIQFEAASLS
jgi:DNA repair exonuclease SbcCD ATPase subunit